MNRLHREVVSASVTGTGFQNASTLAEFVKKDFLQLTLLANRRGNSFVDQ